MHVREPIRVEPGEPPRGSLIWVATDNGDARAAYIEPTGNYRVFNPSSDAGVEVIPSYGFTAWVGPGSHRYVVAVPAQPIGPQVSTSTSTDPASPERTIGNEPAPAERAARDRGRPRSMPHWADATMQEDGPSQRSNE